MKPKFSELLTPSSKLLASLVFAVSGLFSPLVSGQAVLDKTTLGSSQNDYRDFQNSMIPGEKRYGKGEKKEEVDPRTLPSKSIKDPRFGGSLLNMGLDSTEETASLEEKPRSAGDKDSKVPKLADAGGEKDSKVSKQADASGDKDPKASKATQNGDGQNKDQKATSAEKPADNEKTSASKPDGNR